MIAEYFEKERKEFEKLFTDEVLERAKEKILEELEEIKEVEKKPTTQKNKEEYYELFLVELLFDTEDEISEEGEIRKASEKYLKKKQEKEKQEKEKQDLTQWRKRLSGILKNNQKFGRKEKPTKLNKE